MNEELGEVRSELAELKKLVLQLVSRGGERPRNYEHQEAARLIGVHPKTINRMVKSGEIFPIRIRGKSLIPLEEIDRVCRPPQMKSSGATPERTKYDAAAALKRLDELTAKKKKR